MPRILMQNRPDTPTHPGGDTVQMEETAKFLRSLGHEVALDYTLRPDLSNVDIVHLFNLTRPFETLAQARNAIARGKPFVLSSVYWDLESAVPADAYEFPRNILRKCLSDDTRARLRSLLGHGDGQGAAAARDAQAEILRHARMILPNSVAEMEHIIEKFPGLPRERFRVVMNGINRPETQPQGAERKMFVCAGAIGPRKNQLHLVKAFRELPGETLLVIGQPSQGSERYAAAMRGAAGGNVRFRERVDHAEMSAIWRGAKACVQPSYIETPGLSAMEALAAGTPIVVADVPPVREYFGDLAHYCEPGSPGSIAAACRAAMAGPCPDGRAFADRYEWTKALAPLADAYNELTRS
ncbi:MAG: glycosyltransferase family 4 protein [Planctomycetes bacterium]|nr:glycosyltransferase family 4 protein [Planctomycetota bacterium]